jgi:hypothetical protein
MRGYDDEWYKCPECGKDMLYGTDPCPYCKCRLGWTQQGPAYRSAAEAPLQQVIPPHLDHRLSNSNVPASPAENTSGYGKLAVIPPQIKGWNWGAFILGWIWGIGNNTWIALLDLIPYVNLVMPFILGARGNEWAWQNKRWDSVDHFQRVQRSWYNWAIIFTVVILLIGVICVIAIISRVLPRLIL